MEVKSKPYSWSLWENIQSLTNTMMLTTVVFICLLWVRFGFSRRCLSSWGTSSLFLFFVSVINGSLVNYAKCFFCNNWYDYVQFFFIMLIWCVTLIHFEYRAILVCLHLAPLDYSTYLIWCIAELYLLKFYSRLLHLPRHEGYWFAVFFYRNVFIWFFYQGNEKPKKFIGK